MRFATGTLVMSLGQGITTVLQMAFGIVVARELGAAGKGSVAVLLSLLSITAMVGNLGFYRSNMYTSAQGPELRPTLASNAWCLALVSGLSVAGLALALVTLFSGVLLHGIPGGLAALALAAAPLVIFVSYAEGILLGMGAVVPYQAVELGTKLIQLLATGAVLMAHGSVGTVVAVVTGVYALQSLACTVLLALRVGFGKPDLGLLRSMARYASRTYGTNLMLSIVARMDLFFVHDLMGDGAAGIYSLVSQSTDIFSFIPGAAAAQLLPRVAAAEPGAQTASLTCRAARMVLMVMTLVVVVGGFLAGPVVRLLYGAAFVTAVPALWVLLPGCVMRALDIVLSADLAGRGFPPLLVWIWPPLLGLAALAYPLTIGAGGMVGAAGTTCSVYVAASLLAAALFLRTSGASVLDLWPGRRDIVALQHGRWRG